MKYYPVLLLVLFSIAGTYCVKSNLDNAFDPTTPLGIFIGIDLNAAGTSSGADSSSTSGSSGSSPAASICTRTPTPVVYEIAGTYSFNVPSDATGVYIEVIGGGGGGAQGYLVGLAPKPGGSGGDSFVAVSGGSELVRTTGGGGGGSPVGSTGIGGTAGAAGSPAGIPGNVGPVTGTGTDFAAGGGFANTQSGRGGNGLMSMAFFPEGGGSGGSGGKNSVTDTSLAGSTLDITVGSGGTSGYGPNSTSGDGIGESGRVLIIVY